MVISEKVWALRVFYTIGIVLYINEKRRISNNNKCQRKEKFWVELRSTSLHESKKMYVNSIIYLALVVYSR